VRTEDANSADGVGMFVASNVGESAVDGSRSEARRQSEKKEEVL